MYYYQNVGPTYRVLERQVIYYKIGLTEWTWQGQKIKEHHLDTIEKVVDLVRCNDVYVRDIFYKVSDSIGNRVDKVTYACGYRKDPTVDKITQEWATFTVIDSKGTIISKERLLEVYNTTYNAYYYNRRRWWHREGNGGKKTTVGRISCHGGSRFNAKKKLDASEYQECDVKFKIRHKADTYDGDWDDYRRGQTQGWKTQRKTQYRPR